MPVHPALVAILRDLIEEAGLKPGDLLFPGEKGGLPAGSVFRRVWRKARKALLIEHEYSSPVGKRAYDLRHTCLTTWLHNGIPPAQVAAWAGNSVPVLLATYTRCITGQLTELQGRIEEPQRLPTVPAAVKGPSTNFGKFSGKSFPEANEPPYLRTHSYSRRTVESDGRQRLLVPKITHDMRKSTVLAPGKRMIAIDPEYPLFSGVPLEGIVGDWQIDQDGGFGDFVRNRYYRPTPTAVGMLRAENTVERAVQLRLLGRITEDELVKELRSAQVLVPVEDDGSTPRLRERGPGERPFLLMYTGARHAPQGGEHCRWMNAAEVAVRMINLDIEIDEGSAACLDIAASKVAVSPFG